MKKTIYWCLGLCMAIVVLPPWVLWPLFDSMAGMTVLVVSLLFIIPVFFLFSSCFLGQYGKKSLLFPLLQVLLFYISWGTRTDAWGDMFEYCTAYLPISYVAFGLTYWLSRRSVRIQEGKKTQIQDL